MVKQSVPAFNPFSESAARAAVNCSVGDRRTSTRSAASAGWAAAHRPETDGSNGQRVRTNSLYDRAMEGGSIGGLRGVMIRTPESTRGTGRKAEAGKCRPRRNSHQGTHVVERRVEGGNATRFRATAHWTMRSARSRVTRGSSNRRRRTSVVYPNGREPTTRNGSVGRRQDRKSPSTTRTLS